MTAKHIKKEMKVVSMWEDEAQKSQALLQCEMSTANISNKKCFYFKIFQELFPWNKSPYRKFWYNTKMYESCLKKKVQK